MKTNKPETESTKRNRYTLQFKEQAIDRAKRDGVPQAAKDLGIAQSMLYGWQSINPALKYPVLRKRRLGA